MQMIAPGLSSSCSIVSGRKRSIQRVNVPLLHSHSCQGHPLPENRMIAISAEFTLGPQPIRSLRPTHV